MELDERLKTYITLVQAFSPPDLPEMPSEEQMKSNPSALQQYATQFRAVMSNTSAAMTAMKAPRAIPVKIGEKAKPEDAWQPYPMAYAFATLMQMTGQPPEEATLAFNSIISAYHKSDAGAFQCRRSQI